MEQSRNNYNRAGNGAGRDNGGGRGYPRGRGGRNRNYPQRYNNQQQEQYGDGRDHRVSAGGGGGGGAGGGGGRNRNYPQRYSNQQQEQYGDGRDHNVSGAGAGGAAAGGGQQTYRTPTHPRQNGDRVGGNQEARVCSRGVSGSSQPVKSPSSQIDISDLQSQEVPVSPSKDIVEHSKDDGENGYVPIKCPDQDTLYSRNNYNRAGNGAGRNNGGGRGYNSGGEDGRGTDGGYYRRGRGGRNRNYPQRYSNQQQEQYGDGRDHRVSAAAGGGGGGQQTSRTPAYPRQNGNQVPDRVGCGNQEARQNGDRVPDRVGGGNQDARSRVVSGSSQPVKSPSSQIDISDLQIQEVPVSPSKDIVEHSKDDGENGYVPIKRPDQGTLAVRYVSLLVNNIPVKYDPSNTILRYDLDVKLEASSSNRSVKKSIPKSDLRLIQEKLCFDYPDQFPLLKTAYDGEKSIFSAVLLRAGTYMCNYLVNRIFAP